MPTTTNHHIVVDQVREWKEIVTLAKEWLSKAENAMEKAVEVCVCVRARV